MATHFFWILAFLKPAPCHSGSYPLQLPTSLAKSVDSASSLNLSSLTLVLGHSLLCAEALACPDSCSSLLACFRVRGCWRPRLNLMRPEMPEIMHLMEVLELLISHDIRSGNYARFLTLKKKPYLFLYIHTFLNI